MANSPLRMKIRVRDAFKGINISINTGVTGIVIKLITAIAMYTEKNINCQLV